MTLPWKGGKIGLIAAAAEGRIFRFFICCIAALGTVALMLIIPQVIRYTIDSVIGNEPLAAPEFVARLIENIGGLETLRMNIWICAVVLIALALVAELFNLIRTYLSLEIGETVAWRFLNNLYVHIQKLPWEWHVKCKTGDIIQRCTTDVEIISNFIKGNFSEMIRTVFILIIALVMMFSMDVYMSLVSIALVPVIMTFSVVFYRRVGRNFARADDAEGVMQAAAQENYTGVRVVRAFGREAWEVEKFSEKTLGFANIWNKIGKMLGFFWGAGDMIVGLQQTIIIAVGVWRCVRGDLTPGTFLDFYAYCNWMIWPIRQLGRILSDVSRTKVATERIREVLAADPETDPVDSLRPEIKGEICFNKVKFAYNNSDPVLYDISFTVKPGETLAILGATGSGKSSLVHLLCRLYDLDDDSGSITIDGIDIRRIARSHLRRNIGLCLQEPFLFSKTIKENIAAAQTDIQIEELQNAATVAMVHETITGFANGYDTLIGERGVTLSGGQKQRVAIARMLAGNSPVMIFDDSLSAVDTETDARIRSALRHRVKDATVIIISHRVSSLMQADKIMVLKDGTIEDIGSHRELVERDGTYRRIFDLQTAGIANEENYG